jgi:transcriptional regulator with XRE-family HTH domain
MGTKRRPKPARLAEKLLEIRNKLGLSQNGLIRRLGLANQLVQAEISAYELGIREPSLYVLLQYAKSANILVEWMIDDEIDLPENIPAEPLPAWVGRIHSSSSSRNKRRT